MKKLICLVLALVTVLSLAACGGKNGNTEASSESGSGLKYEGVTIKFWSPVGDMGYFGALADAWKEKTGCTVESAVIPWSDLSTKYVTAFLSNNGPDVFYITSGLVADLYDGGRLLDLTDYFTQEELEERRFMDTCYYEDIQFAVPYNVNSGPRAWAFNMDILKKVGYDKAPETWDELIDAAVKIKEANICKYPLLIPMNGGTEATLEGFLSLLFSNGGKVCNDDFTAMTLDSKECVETCQFIYDLVYKYEVLSTDCLSLDTMAVSTQFYKSNCAMCTVYAESPLYSKDEDVFFVKTKKGELKKVYEPFTYEVTFGVGNNGNPAMSCCPVDWISVNADSKNKQAAVDYMKFLCKEGYEIYVDYYEKLYETNHSEGKILTPPLFKGDKGREIYHEWHQKLVDTMDDHSFTMPLVPGAATMDVVYFSNIQMLIMGEVTPEECAKTMQEECMAALEG